MFLHLLLLKIFKNEGMLKMPRSSRFIKNCDHFIFKFIKNSESKKTKLYLTIPLEIQVINVHFDLKSLYKNQNI